MDDCRSQIPQMAFINAQIIQGALANGDLRESLRAAIAHYKLPEYQLINPAYIASLLYCLVVVPKEVWDPPSNDGIYKVLEPEQPLNLFQITRWKAPAGEHPIRDFLRHLRNAIAHANFRVGDDQLFEFWDERAGQENFRVSIKIVDLARFLSIVDAQLANLRGRSSLPR